MSGGAMEAVAGERSFRSADGTALTGTFVRPGSEPPFPAALLLVGSGAVDRDSDAPKLPLGVTRHLADHLSQAGIASLRFDKRGVGGSEGEFLPASFEDGTADARAALEELRTVHGVDRRRIVVIGHSEGAFHAMALATDEELAGVALLAGGARSGGRILRWQAEVLPPSLPWFARVLLRVLRVDLSRRQDKLFARLDGTDDAVLHSGGRELNAAWLRGFVAFDPAAVLPHIDVPVLALTGAKDLQSPPEDIERMRALVTSSFDGTVIPDVNHILRHEPAAPSVRNYRRETDQPLDDRVVATLIDWCRRILPA